MIISTNIIGRFLSKKPRTLLNSNRRRNWNILLSQRKRDNSRVGAHVLLLCSVFVPFILQIGSSPFLTSLQSSDISIHAATQPCTAYSEGLSFHQKSRNQACCILQDKPCILRRVLQKKTTATSYLSSDILTHAGTSTLNTSAIPSHQVVNTKQ